MRVTFTFLLNPEHPGPPVYVRPTLGEARQWTLKPLPRPRWLARWRAAWRGNFWLPCPVCGRHFAGFEWERDNSVDLGGGSGQGFCPGHVRPADWPTTGAHYAVKVKTPRRRRG